MEKEHQSKEEAISHFVKEMTEKAAAGDGFVACLITKKEGKLEVAIRTTYQFPRGDYVAVLSLMAENLHGDILSSEKNKLPPPLPKVNKEDLLRELHNHGGPVDNSGLGMPRQTLPGHNIHGMGVPPHLRTRFVDENGASQQGQDQTKKEEQP
jgi:hypothetical protein